MKTRIMMAAAQEMNERGVKFTIDAVVAKLGISKKTFYQYYPSKDAVIEAIVDAAIVDENRQEREILASDRSFAQKLAAYLSVTPQLFGRINEWIIDDIRRYRPLDWERIVQHHQAKETELGRLLESGVVSGSLRPINVQVAARLLLASCNELLEFTFLTQANLTMESALAAYTDIFLNGILQEREAGGV